MEAVKAELDITGRRIDKQIKAAIKANSVCSVCGVRIEIAGAYTVRNLVESDEQKVGAERIVTIVKDLMI